MGDRIYYVYILTNKNHTVLYTGVTNDLKRRVYQHQQGLGSAFTKRYNVFVLVYYEGTPSQETAIMREKQIKGGSRQKKLDLINQVNPCWKDLSTKL